VLFGVRLVSDDMKKGEMRRKHTKRKNAQSVETQGFLRNDAKP